METFKRGDTVKHPRYGKGDVQEVFPDLRLVEVLFYFTPGGSTKITVHPVTLTREEPAMTSSISITKGDALSNAVDIAESHNGYEASAGRKDAIFHVGHYIQTQDEAAFNDAYDQLTDTEDNSSVYIANFTRTVSQLTEIIACGKSITGQ